MKRHKIDQNKGEVYMLIDLHAHSSGISRCCQIPFEQVLKQTLDNGMNGIVLTKHYQKSYVGDDCLDNFVENYITEFFSAEQYGKKIGCKVYFGIELTTELYPNVHMLIYGVGPEFLRKHPYLFDLTQKELYKLVKSNNGILVQAHPFRNGTTVLDTEYMDGVEINCHPLYGKSYAEKLLCIAKDNHLIVTCGGDFHADTYRPKCGMFFFEEIKDHHDLGSYLLSSEGKKLCIQEPNSTICSTICIK